VLLLQRLLGLLQINDVCVDVVNLLLHRFETFLCLLFFLLDCFLIVLYKINFEQIIVFQVRYEGNE
jgi:hypothetical protein